MGTAGVSGHPNPTDNLALFNPLASTDLVFFHVQILRFVGGVVFYFDINAIAPSAFCFGHHAICGSQNRGTHWSSKISAFMGPDLVSIGGNAAP